MHRQVIKEETGCQKAYDKIVIKETEVWTHTHNPLNQVTKVKYIADEGVRK